MRTRPILIAMILSTSTVVAGAATQISPLSGVWSGTIGEQKVMACIDDDNSTYYYLRHSWGIPLSKKDQAERTWVESNPDKPTGIWKLGQRSGNRVEGQWLDPKRNRTLPISLTLLPDDSKKAGGCSDSSNPYSQVFNAPRVDAQKITVEEKEFRGHRYRTISTLGGVISTIELSGERPSVASINKVLRARLRNGIPEYFELITRIEKEGVRNRSDANFFEKTELGFLNNDWASVVEISAWDAGNGPRAYSRHRTWDIRNGKEVDLLTWIKHTKTEPGGGYELPEKLDELIFSRRHDGCADFDGRYELGLSPDSVVFTTEQYGRGFCTDSIEIPYHELRRFLTPAGKAAISSITAQKPNNVSTRHEP